MSENKKKNYRTGMRSPRGMVAGDKARNFRGTIAKLIRYMKPFYVQIIIITLFTLGSTIFSIIGPRILGSATTTLAEGLAAAQPVLPAAAPISLNIWNAPAAIPEIPAAPAAPTSVIEEAAVPMAAPQTEAQQIAEIEEEAVPMAAPQAEEQIAEIEEEAIPQAAPAGAGAWALVNLILAAAAALLSILTGIFHFIGRENDDDDNNDSTDNSEELKRHGLIRILNILSGIAAVILFIRTEDMRLPMVLTDRWTVIMAVIFLANVLLAVLSKKSREDSEEQQMAAGLN